MIDPVPLSAEQQAQAWLDDVFGDPGRTAEEALAVLNRVMYLHRLAAADPHVHGLTGAEAGRAGGMGPGRGAGRGALDPRSGATAAGTPRRSLFGRRSKQERTTELLHVEHMAALLGSREHPLVCEELALRARLDLDSGRLAHAALELRHALTAAVAELRREDRQDLVLRVDELAELSEGVELQAAGAAGGRARSRRRRGGAGGKARRRGPEPRPRTAGGGAAGSPAARLT